ncbi:MAG: endonuclease [Christensenellaceae bacterium]|nr:endonuclease [Christensenellaceae bacterium]
MKRILKGMGILLLAVVILLVGLIAFLSITEYKPEETEPASFVEADASAEPVDPDAVFTLCTWNVGYGGLGEESDFFMDGGEMVNPPSQEVVEKNLAGIEAHMQSNPADAWLLQEVDVNSARSGFVDQRTRFGGIVGGNTAFAYNYKCKFVPIPLPPMGKVESGIVTFTSAAMQADAQRISLPCPFSWPVSAANLKRCLLVTRLPVKGSNKELVIVNLHLEAYDDGEGRIAQSKMLMEFLEAEYAKGNYVIAGGDFNQAFPGTLEKYPIAEGAEWQPGQLEQAALSVGWEYAFDSSAATCRLLDKPYADDSQKYVIDGFILSPNVQLVEVKTQDLGFAYADHNPVRLQVRFAK